MGNVDSIPGSGSLSLSGQRPQILLDFVLNQSGRFFPFVLTYLAASAGFTPVYDAEHYPDFMKGVAGIFPGTTTASARASLEQVVTQIRAGVLPQRRAEQSLCCMLANICFESIEQADLDRVWLDPVIQFFRHVRNAASHANQWHFLGQEPKHRAEWNGIVLDKNLRGTECFYGTLSPADLLYLLQAVERLL
jgi:hypothetical protein